MCAEFRYIRGPEGSHHQFVRLFGAASSSGAAAGQGTELLGVRIFVNVKESKMERKTEREKKKELVVAHNEEKEKRTRAVVVEKEQK